MKEIKCPAAERVRTDETMGTVVDILQKLEYRIEDYLGAGRDAVIGRGVELCRRHGAGEASLAAEVAAFLDCSCRQRMAESAAWRTPWRDVTDGARVSAVIGTEEVEGLVSLSTRRIGIRLLKPFPGESASVSIAPSVPAAYTERTRRGVRASEFGKARLRRLMVDLYFDRLSQTV